MDAVAVAADSDVRVHCFCDSDTPCIYYWNALPEDIGGNTPTATPDPQSSESPLATPTVKPSSTVNPDIVKGTTDFREESIYFLMTTRFYDGDSSNNVYCEEDAEVGNGDSDPAWHVDFAGLIEKLDYIKALGFSAIWITPVVENASAYDYHGYHALNFKKVDLQETARRTYGSFFFECRVKTLFVQE